MRHALWLVPLALSVPSCKFKDKPRFIAVNPDYAYTDGCKAVTFSGSSLGTEATAAIGDNAIADLSPAEYDTALPEHAQDVGFVYHGSIPVATSADSAFVDVTMTIDGETFTLDRGFYYIGCPDTFYLDDYTLGEAHSPGDAVDFIGCGLDDAELVFFDPADGSEVASTAVTSVCNGAEVRAEIPAMADGTYYAQLRDENGTTFGDVCSDTDIDTDTDTGGDPCADLNLLPVTITNGGAR